MNDDDQGGPKPAETTDDGQNLKELWRRLRDTGDAEARNALSEFYFDMVRAHSENVARLLVEAIEENDIYQAGVVGFFEALGDFDPDKHGSFEEFGSVAIRHSIVKELEALLGAE